MTFSLKALGRYKYILLLLLAALVLLLLPSGSGSGGAEGEEARLEQVLSEVAGAGRVSVLCSENGAAVVCDGAARPDAGRLGLHRPRKRQDKRAGKGLSAADAKRIIL